MGAMGIGSLANQAWHDVRHGSPSRAPVAVRRPFILYAGAGKGASLRLLGRCAGDGVPETARGDDPNGDCILWFLICSRFALIPAR